MNDHKIKNYKKIKFGTLYLSAIGTMIGSGWLFGAAHAAAIAGPASIFSWIIGSIIILIFCLCLVEISSIAPSHMGSIGAYLKYTHGNFACFLSEWMILLGFISSIPGEAVASIQYMSHWNYSWAKDLYDTNINTLSKSGLFFSCILCVIYFLINYWSLNFLTKSIRAITIFKISIPLLTITLFLYFGFDSHNLHAIGNHSIAPYGYSGILSAITNAGIIYSFFGFQAPLTFALEAENPKLDIPKAMILSVLSCAIIYTLLQYAYIVTMPKNILYSSGGWSGVNLSSPFVQLSASIGLNVMTILLYFDAFISPTGTGIIYSSLAPRVLCSLSPYMSQRISTLDKKTGLPKIALCVVLLISILCLILFPSWDKLASIISVGYVLCFAFLPICSLSFRKLIPNINNNSNIIRYKLINILAPISFIICTYMFYWSRWPLTGKILIFQFIGIPIFIYYDYKINKSFLKELSKSIWIILYMIFLSIISYLGSKKFGGIGYIPDIIDHIILTIFALIFFYWGYFMSYKTEFFKDKFT